MGKRLSEGLLSEGINAFFSFSCQRRLEKLINHSRDLVSISHPHSLPHSPPVKTFSSSPNIPVGKATKGSRVPEDKGSLPETLAQPAVNRKIHISAVLSSLYMRSLKHQNTCMCSEESRTGCFVSRKHTH